MALMIRPFDWRGLEGEPGDDIVAKPDVYHQYTVRYLSAGLFDVVLDHELGSLWFRSHRGETHTSYAAAKAAAEADYAARARAMIGAL